MTEKTFDLIEQAEKAIDANDYPALAETSVQIVDILKAALVLDSLYLLEPLLVIGKKLAEREEYLRPAIEAVKAAYSYAPAGSELEQQAVDTWAKYTVALREAARRKPEAPRISTLQQEAARQAARRKPEALCIPSQRAAQRFLQKYKL